MRWKTNSGRSADDSQTNYSAASNRYTVQRDEAASAVALSHRCGRFTTRKAATDRHRQENITGCTRLLCVPAQGQYHSRAGDSRTNWRGPRHGVASPRRSPRTAATAGIMLPHRVIEMRAFSLASLASAGGEMDRPRRIVGCQRHNTRAKPVHAAVAATLRRRDLRDAQRLRFRSGSPTNTASTLSRGSMGFREIILPNKCVTTAQHKSVGVLVCDAGKRRAEQMTILPPIDSSALPSFVRIRL